MPSKVALVRCESYEYTAVREAVGKGLSLIGGVSRFVSGGEKILLKPNLLAGEAPEKCVTTNPSVFRAIAEILMEKGIIVTYGDSPATGKMHKAAGKAGLAEIADELGIEAADFRNGTDHFFDKGLMNRKFTIARAVSESDGMISLPKLKTHGLEKFTGCIKNQFGCIPGMRKGEFHLKLPDAEAFAKMLVDLNHLVAPRLYIMDGICGMEGNGPRGGTPRRMNMLLFSGDPVALDATVCRLINLTPEHVPTTRYGMLAGMGTYLEEEIAVVGDDMERFYAGDFEIDRKPLKSFEPRFFSHFLNRRLVAKPFIEAEKCVRCGECVAICPARPRALFFRENEKSGVPVYDYDHCIRCFCCQEICPQSAIYLKTPLLRKLIGFF